MNLRALVASAIVLLASPFAQADDALPFNRPQADLYTYGQPSAAQLQQAAAAGITTVIDLRTPGEERGYDEQAAAEALGLRYVRLPVAGGGGLSADNARALHQILGNDSGPVLLHCATSNRAGALLALRAAQQQGWEAPSALELGQAAGLRQPALLEQVRRQITPDSTPQP
ncbi:hypothetical protein ABB30_03945 [Stenotrophomonas ginsengisoli]|uniref:Beta-lactamase hydrolase-like protein phosphatase-like domain-containing protein n=1 Tax=Stenotrophomonas ginsengisoli TaxID=336566 RepID=A0A0R0DIB1_9GAMM|nr:sulfur transferase domain-containing protein [Stenotrophomonas ginsengisoli]KRG78466.1 hypothetical protein ABB30_03945 [Stenotrophomonas ginsengisoli]